MKIYLKYISFNSFYSTIEKIIDKHLPLRKITKKEHKNKSKPWITTDQLHSLFIKSKNITTKAQFLAAYKMKRNQLVDTIRKSKQQFYQSYFSRYDTNSRKICDAIKGIINIKS